MQENTDNINHHDQVGFIPWIQGWFNKQKPINAIHHVNKVKDKTDDYLNRCLKRL